MSEKKEEIISTRAKIGEVMNRIKRNASYAPSNSEYSFMKEQNIYPEFGDHLLLRVYETTPGKRSNKTISDMKVYALSLIHISEPTRPY